MGTDWHLWGCIDNQGTDDQCPEYHRGGLTTHGAPGQ
ncbi:unnamed protein product [Staurois parvus]|uniref:Uncharacterized protein n=1 Tax=Staurois parvus TaxID=386267 RepID=A0ABN9GGX1_9NEOB|nr:unnamed protein product [Staurois parvus]